VQQSRAEMTGGDSLIEGNRTYGERVSTDLPRLPRRGLVILTCMDHRIDPVAALGLELGDAMVIRNAGGRVTPSSIQSLRILDRVASRRGSGLSELELVLMQHTDCGAGGLAGEHDELLAAHFGVPADQLETKAPSDPYEAVRVDIDALAGDRAVPGSLSVTGLVYDVASGHAELVERRAPLREPS
jgi:carbonic anhydrase